MRFTIEQIKEWADRGEAVSPHVMKEVVQEYNKLSGILLEWHSAYKDESKLRLMEISMITYDVLEEIGVINGHNGPERTDPRTSSDQESAG